MAPRASGVSPVALTPLRMHGVTSADGASTAIPAELVAFRDIGALVDEVGAGSGPPSASEIARYREVVEGVFQQRPVIPAPPGTVFESRDALERWLELHYVALSDGLEFVEGRAAGRVHFHARDTHVLEEARADLTGAATERFRLLRRQAVAGLPLRVLEEEGAVLSAAFLVERLRWDAFVEAVAVEDRRADGLRSEVSGPWPPYDFVRMEFGG